MLLLLLEALFSPLLPLSPSPSLLCGRFSPGARAGGGDGGAEVPPLLLLSLCGCCGRVAVDADAGAAVDGTSTCGTRNHRGAAILAAVR